MAKRDAYYPEAERLYVHEQCSHADIAARLGISERTIGTWAREGDWTTRRRNYLAQRKAFHEELYEFTRLLLGVVKDDLTKVQNGELPEISSSKVYALIKLIPLLTKTKEYEEAGKKLEAAVPEAKTDQLTGEQLADILRTALGG